MCLDKETSKMCIVGGPKGTRVGTSRHLNSGSRMTHSLYGQFKTFNKDDLAIVQPCSFTQDLFRLI